LLSSWARIWTCNHVHILALELREHLRGERRLGFRKKDQQVTPTHTPTENNTPDTHTNDKNNTPNPQTNTSHKHLTTLGFTRGKELRVWGRGVEL